VLLAKLCLELTRATPHSLCAEFFFAINLFKAVTLFPALTNVVKAVSVPARPLGLTFLLFLICIYSVRGVAPVRPAQRPRSAR